MFRQLYAISFVYSRFAPSAHASLAAPLIFLKSGANACCVPGCR